MIVQPLASISTWLQAHPTVLPLASAAIAVIALSFTARSFYLNARATKLTLFNNVRQRIEDAGKKVESLNPPPSQPTADHYAFLNELEWLCHLVRQKDIPLSMFEPYYGDPFLGAVDDYRHVLEAVRREEAGAYGDILWVEKELAWRKLIWRDRLPFPWRRHPKYFCGTSAPAATKAAIPPATGTAPPASSR